MNMKTNLALKLKKALMITSVIAISLAFLAPATATQAQARTKTSRAKVVWYYLRHHGYSRKAAAGILGNLDQESGISATAGSSYYGLMQWGGSRKSRLYSYARTQSTSASNLKTQVKYLVHHDCSNLKANMNRHDGSIAEATQYFERTYERAGIPAMSNRISKAKHWHKKLKKHELKKMKKRFKVVKTA